MKGDKINDLFNQGMGNYDPKKQKYFHQIKYNLGYSKDDLRENFEKLSDKEFENPYKTAIKIVNKN